MLRKIEKSNQVSWIFLLALLPLMVRLEVDATPILTGFSSTTEKAPRNLNLGTTPEDNQKISPFQERNNGDDDFGLVEVKENEIPEGVEVYVSEYPAEVLPEDGEILKTDSNIVFRPLFRYKSKQEALRRTTNGANRRYFISKRQYRHAYHPYHPYYYRRYYYYY
ncbi:hypothetical protein RUM43_004228 [Polyplax serrata]|uniref:Uncharacterized protein n=1 Tax=Polyplax serrata TaxID=468196 RepID=A0AAN8SAN1_POLSC